MAMPLPGHRPSSSDSGSSSSLTPTNSNSLFNPEEAKFITDSLSSAESFDPFTIGAPGFKVPNLLPPNLASNQAGYRYTMPANADNVSVDLAFAGPPGVAMDMRAIADSMRHKGPEAAQALNLASVNQKVDPYNAPLATHRQNSWSMYGPPRGTPVSQMRHASAAATASGYGKDRAWQLEQLQFLESQANASRRQEQRQRSAADLAMLGLSFPSSHNFPASEQQRLQQQQQQQMMQASSSQLSSSMASMLYGDAGLNQASHQQQMHNYSPSQETRTTPTPTSVGKRMWGSMSAETRDSQDGSPSSVTPTRSISATDRNNRGRSPSVRPPWTASSTTGLSKRSDSSSGTPGKTDRSVAIVQALAELAHVDMDLDAASQRLPAPLTEFYAPLNAEKRVQPHLEILRQQHLEAGLIDETGKELNRDEAADGEKEAKKQGHTLLTDAEKKANHIASEQKRRANIRKGYELLCDIVPPLKEALEREAKREKDEGKKKENDVSAGCEIDGEKIDGRAGPRSEAVVLMKSLEHMSAQLERHRALLGRRNRARLALAKLHGMDIAKQPLPDMEALVRLKMSQDAPRKPADPFAMLQD